MINYKTGELLGEQCYFLKDLEKVTKNRKALFTCRCGKEFIAAVDKVKSKRKTDCGCLNKVSSSRITHGLINSPEYSIWTNIKTRCYNVNSPRYKDYGGRGITMCDRWLNSFENFIEDVGFRPSEKHSLDRVENEGNYEPGNFRWATKLEQSNNTRSNVFVTFKEKRQTISEWAREYNIKPHILHKRYSRGWDFHEALITQVISRV